MKNEIYLRRGRYPKTGKPWASLEIHDRNSVRIAVKILTKADMISLIKELVREAL